MTIDEMTAKVLDGNRITYGEAKEFLVGHETYSNGVYNFDNCVLSCNSLDDDAVLYNPLV